MHVRSVLFVSLLRAVAMVLCCVAALASTGCYKHVIRVEGPGSDAYDVYEPNYRPEDDPFVSKPKEKGAADKVPSQIYKE
jgi:hypothetical protein